MGSGVKKITPLVALLATLIPAGGESLLVEAMKLLADIPYSIWGWVAAFTLVAIYYALLWPVSFSLTALSAEKPLGGALRDSLYIYLIAYMVSLALFLQGIGRGRISLVEYSLWIVLLAGPIATIAGLQRVMGPGPWRGLRAPLMIILATWASWIASLILISGFLEGNIVYKSPVTIYTLVYRHMPYEVVEEVAYPVTLLTPSSLVARYIACLVAAYLTEPGEEAYNKL